MPTTTEAYVARPGSLKLENVKYADLDANDVLVDIAAASICHTDVKAAEGVFHMKPPMIIGHEAAGYVKEVGSAVTYVKPGDAVVLAFAWCGACRRCMSGKQPYCEKLWELNFGGKRDDGSVAVTAEQDGVELNGLFFGQSSMSRAALVRENCCVKIDCSKTELQLFASLGCGIQTGAGAILNVAKPAVGSSVAIFGGGAVGLSAILAAKLTSPACLVLVDNSKTKLDMIPKELVEGVHLVNSADKTPEEVAAELKKLTPGGVGMDFAMDGVGHEAVLLAAHLSLDKLGTALIVGGSPTAKIQAMIEGHLVNGLTTRGMHQGDSVPRVMLPHLVKLWKDGKFPFDKLLTKFAFEDLHKALEEMHKGKVIKPLLVL